MIGFGVAAYGFPNGAVIASGQVPTMGVVRKLGYTNAVGTSETPLNTGNVWWQPTTAASLEAISTSANDTVLGTGARTIVIEGLNDSYAVATETVALNGIAATSATATRFIRVYRAYVAAVGTYAGTNAGTITVRIGGAGTTVASIDANSCRAQIGGYTVPLGYVAYVQDLHLSAGTAASTKPVDIRMYELPSINLMPAPFPSVKLVQFFAAINTVADFDYTSCPLAFAPLSDIWFTGTVASGSGAASTSLGLLLIKQ